ncbi:AarF/ABC1/UbiB kinase family protein [uncultured Thiothrix sp.]|uniref:ABC1 kinase family protein n=1 Tax=uncultured Thiothrix sp. TaxID=223185 RepID=UPI002608CC89|nr:AarF/ABC1/UbiB kinase family protein [uncultured Thiothrix sp.]
MMEQSLPEGKWVRAGIMGSTALKVGLREVQHKVKRPFMSVERQQSDKQTIDDKNAELIFKALAQLRGTALKAAQMLSMEVEILPERYRKELEKSFHQVPPLNRVLVRKAIQEQLGKPPEMLFKRFNDQAFAAASLGQVHHATLWDDTPVAVKIQYPGIHVAMDSDMKLMRKLAPSLPNPQMVAQSLEEIHARLLEEVDYAHEAAATQWFAEHLSLTGVQIPKVYKEFSAARILTTELMTGQHLDAWLATNPSQAASNQAAQNLYDILIYSVRTLNRLHADPNPGNYLFQTDGTVSLIDFGCTKQFDPKFVRILPVLIKAFVLDNRESALAAYRELGMDHHHSDETWYREILRPFAQWAALPLQEPSFDFGKNHSYTSQAREIIQKLAQNTSLDKIANDFIFFDRTMYGLCKIFERMGAEVRMRHHWLEN